MTRQALLLLAQRHRSARHPTPTPEEYRQRMAVDHAETVALIAELSRTWRNPPTDRVRP